MLYDAFACSRLEYASAIWSPVTKAGSQLIEAIHKDFYGLFFFFLKVQVLSELLQLWDIYPQIRKFFIPVGLRNTNLWNTMAGTLVNSTLLQQNVGRFLLLYIGCQDGSPGYFLYKIV